MDLPVSIPAAPEPPTTVARVVCEHGRTTVWDANGVIWELLPGEALYCDPAGWHREPNAGGASEPESSDGQDSVGASPTTAPNPAAITAEAVEAYLRDHCAQASLARTAAHFCCHPHSITRLLRRAGRPPFQGLLTQLRMERAWQLLSAEGLPVAVVARQCGYKNMTHFYRLFREHHGRGPGEVRREALLRHSTTVAMPPSTMSAHPASSNGDGSNPASPHSTATVTPS